MIWKWFEIWSDPNTQFRSDVLQKQREKEKKWEYDRLTLYLTDCYSFSTVAFVKHQKKQDDINRISVLLMAKRCRSVQAREDIRCLQNSAYFFWNQFHYSNRKQYRGTSLIKVGYMALVSSSLYLFPVAPGQTTKACLISVNSLPQGLLFGLF